MRKKLQGNADSRADLLTEQPGTDKEQTLVGRERSARDSGQSARGRSVRGGWASVVLRKRFGLTSPFAALATAVIVIVTVPVVADVTTAAGANKAAASGQVSGCPIEAIARRDLPSVVTVTVNAGKSSSTGSGEVIDRAGHVLTNNHVVAAAAGSDGRISVLFSDGRSLPATIKGRDPDTDLAVLTVDGEAGVPPIALGSSSVLRVGQTVVVLGAPLGLSGTVTSGIVSAVGRMIAVPGEGTRKAFLVNAIQTDAAINPGNSGGALVNCSGQLVGVPSAGATVPLASGGRSAGSIGLGFAIPVEMAKTISTELIATGRAHHAELGLETSPAFGVTYAVKGLYVDAVVPGGPAAQADLRAGDLLTRIDGKPATTPNQLNALELTRPPGSKVVFTFERTSQTGNATVVLGNAP